jgi:hypothetical protein
MFAQRDPGWYFVTRKKCHAYRKCLLRHRSRPLQISVSSETGPTAEEDDQVQVQRRETRMACGIRAAAERLRDVRRLYGNGHWGQSDVLWSELRSLLACSNLASASRVPDARAHANGTRLRLTSPDALWRPISDAIAEGDIGAEAAPPSSFIVMDVEATDVSAILASSRWGPHLSTARANFTPL